VLGAARWRSSCCLSCSSRETSFTARPALDQYLDLLPQRRLLGSQTVAVLGLDARDERVERLAARGPCSDRVG